MKLAINTFQVTFENLHACSVATLMVLTINSRKRVPCIGPNMAENDGMPNIRFNGTATKTKSTSDVPSKKASNRNLPILEFKNDFI